MADVMPAVYGKDVLQTPRFLIDYFGVGEYVPPANDPAPGGRGGGVVGVGRPLVTGGGGAAAGGGGGHNWGSAGSRLGTN